jgi:hypothetical protein
MKRLVPWIVPFVVVVAVNLIALWAGGSRSTRWYWLQPSGSWSYFILALTALCALLLAWGRARPWVLVVPALPALVASVGAWRWLSITHAEITRWAPDEGSYGFAPWRSQCGDYFDEALTVMGSLRVIASVEGLALALALVVVRAPDWWKATRSPGARAWGLAWGYLGLAVVSLGGPYLGFLRTYEPRNVAALPTLLAVVLPALLVLALRRTSPPPPPVEDTTPYREPATRTEIANDHAVEPVTAAFFMALLLPSIARSYGRGLILQDQGTPSWDFTGKVMFLDPPDAPGVHLNLLLARLEHWLLPASVVLAGVALWRGADRRVVRAWAVAMALLATDRIVVARYTQIMNVFVSVAPKVPRVWAWTLAHDWVETAPASPAGTRHERWAANGTVAPVARAALTPTLSYGTVVYLDPRMSGRVLSEHLRRWRARSSSDSLTFAGECPRQRARAWRDAHQEITPTRTLELWPERCDVMLTVPAGEQASGDRAPWDATVRVENETSAVLEAQGAPSVRVDLSDWSPPRPRSALRVIATGDRVTARDVLRVAFRLSERRARVLLGW